MKRKNIYEVKNFKLFMDEQNDMKEGLFDRLKKKEVTPEITPDEKVKQESYFDVFLRELKNGEYSLPIMFTVLDGGFKTNKKYGNPVCNYYSFDVRGNQEIITLIYNEESFVKIINHKNKEYMVVGLTFNKQDADVSELSLTWRTSGRYGYVFAIIEYTNNIVQYIKEKIPGETIENILISEAINSAKQYFNTIRDWGNAIKPPKTYI
jgi:hypothetical protein